MRYLKGPASSPVRLACGHQDTVEWASGIIEGEGWIGARKGGSKPRISVEMTDFDVVARVYAVFNVGLVRRNPPRKGANRQPTWYWRVYKRDELLPVLLQIRPWMSKRRTERIDRVLRDCYSRDEVITCVKRLTF